MNRVFIGVPALRIAISFLLLPWACLAEGFKPDEKGFEKQIKPFLGTYCTSCHGKEETKGELRLDHLSADLVAEQSWDIWHEVLNQLNGNNMPPKKAKQHPETKEKLAVIDWLEDQLHQVRIALEQSGTQPAMRRMNRYEYQNTIRDLMGIPYDDVIHYPQVYHAFPEDPSVDGFDTASAGLKVSSLHMEKYLKHGRAIVETALSRKKSEHWRVDFCKKDGDQYKKLLAKNKPSNWKDSAFFINLKDPEDRRKFEKVWPLYDRASAKNTYRPEYVEDAVFRLDRNRKQKIEHNALIRFDVQHSGIYRFKIRARVAGPIEGPVVVSLHRGKRRVIAMREFVVEHRDFQEFELVEYMEKGLDAMFMAWVDKLGRRDPSRELQLEIDYAEVEGPIPETDSQEQLAFLGTDQDVKKLKLDQGSAKKLLSHFADKATRRPTTEQELKRIFASYHDCLQVCENPLESLIETMGGILASPEFIHVHKPMAVKGEFALASRLSYFLWSSMPDDELLELASKGRLSNPEVLEQQVSRMLDDEKSKAFVRNFCGQWLHLRSIAEVMPDKKIYPEYNEALQNYMVEETYQFFGELLRQDLSIVNFIDSDFAMLNERLASFYRFRTGEKSRNIRGKAFRRVALLPEDHRGGILAHASILKITSNCTRVSPVKRGAFILENLLGITPTPPPPNVGEIVSAAPGSGETTLREQLKQHRTQATCAACHAKIDPLGFALHHYDAIGAYRTHEGSGGKRHREPTGGAIDATGILPDGRSFNGLTEFKKILIEDKSLFARCLTEKLMQYALGRPINPGDHSAMDTIQKDLQESDYRFRALIKSIVRSKPFVQINPNP